MVAAYSVAFIGGVQRVTKCARVQNVVIESEGGVVGLKWTPEFGHLLKM
jgi:hypothetical protein